MMAATIAAAAAGCYLHLKMHIGSPLFALGLFGLIFALYSTPNSPANQQKRTGMLLAFGALQGLVVGPLVEAVLDIDSSIVLTAFLGTTAIFVCFSLAAIYAERRSMLYLGGFLSSALSLLLMAGFINIFARSEGLFNLQLYGGLLVFMGYIVFDSQMIIEKADAGIYDVQLHALDLFLDFVAIFVRLLIILSKNKKNNKEKSSTRRR